MNIPQHLSECLARWRREAHELQERYGQPALAQLTLNHAEEIERELRSAENETVSLTDGAKLSGYSADSLGRLVRTGKLKNYGRTNAPKIRVADLPRKLSTLQESSKALTLVGTRKQTARVALAPYIGECNG